MTGEAHCGLDPTLSHQTRHGHTANAVAEKFELKKGHFCKVLTLAAAGKTTTTLLKKVS